MTKGDQFSSGDPARFKSSLAKATWVLRPAGDSALTVDLGEQAKTDPGAVEGVVAAICRLPAVREVVPAFSTILVRYDSLATDYDRMRDALLRLKPHRGQRPLPRRFVVPVAYGGRLGPDLEGLARLHGLSAEKVVALHAGRDYRIASLGFSPGFPYLEGLPKELVTPRLPTPRTRVPAGSVGIGGRFTGIYPQAAPGGWHIIGRTPCRLFSPRHIPPVPYQVGDVVRFQPISEAEFDRLAAHPPDLRSAPAEEAR